MKFVIQNNLNNEILEFNEDFSFDLNIGVQKLDNIPYLELFIKEQGKEMRWRFYYDIMETYSVNMILNYIEKAKDLVVFTFDDKEFNVAINAENEKYNVSVVLDGFCYVGD